MDNNFTTVSLNVGYSAEREACPDEDNGGSSPQHVDQQLLHATIRLYKYITSISIFRLALTMSSVVLCCFCLLVKEVCKAIEWCCGVVVKLVDSMKWFCVQILRVSQ